MANHSINMAGTVTSSSNKRKNKKGKGKKNALTKKQRAAVREIAKEVPETKLWCVPHTTTVSKNSLYTVPLLSGAYQGITQGTQVWQRVGNKIHTKGIYIAMKFATNYFNLRTGPMYIRWFVVKHQPGVAVTMSDFLGGSASYYDIATPDSYKQKYDVLKSGRVTLSPPNGVDSTDPDSQVMKVKTFKISKAVGPVQYAGANTQSLHKDLTLCWMYTQHQASSATNGLICNLEVRHYYTDA